MRTSRRRSPSSGAATRRGRSGYAKMKKEYPARDGARRAMRYAARAAGQSPTFTPPARTRARLLFARAFVFVFVFVLVVVCRSASAGTFRRYDDVVAAAGASGSSSVGRLFRRLFFSSSTRAVRHARKSSSRATSRGANASRREARRARRDASRPRCVAPPALWPRRRDGRRRNADAVLLNTRDAVLLNTEPPSS